MKVVAFMQKKGEGAEDGLWVCLEGCVEGGGDYLKLKERLIGQKSV